MYMDSDMSHQDMSFNFDTNNVLKDVHSDPCTPNDNKFGVIEEVDESKVINKRQVNFSREERAHEIERLESIRANYSKN